ncbi:MAG: hypothetical protein ACO25T_04325 [Arenimonas sp.]|jgi:hypothetical protein|uniref:hypothetical protein n=1 Tax=Arenimonas sp. TaxID=1872635 RepID=UPI003BFF8DA4
MIWLRRVCLLLLFANAGALMWNLWRPELQGHVLPMTEPGTPGLILHQEYLQLQQERQRLPSGSCWRIGPFAEEAAMRRAWQSLEYITLDMQMRMADGVIGTRYRLDIPASASRADAELLVESLLSAGIGNPEIQSDHSIALGQFATLADAQSRQRVVQQLGLEALLRSEQQTRREWWIDASIRNQAGFRQWQAEQNPKIPAQACR